MITINGALLFNSGKAVLTEDANAIIDNLSKILADYTDNIIEVEGHTDNVPMHSGTYETMMFFQCTERYMLLTGLDQRQTLILHI